MAGVEDASGRPLERLSGPILTVARLLAHEHDLRADEPVTEDGLRPGQVERAGLAPGRRLLEVRERRPLGNEWGRRLLGPTGHLLRITRAARQQTPMHLAGGLARRDAHLVE